MCFQRLPADIRKALRPAEVEAYQGGTAYFTDRAKRCASPVVRKFFRLLGTGGGPRLHLYAGARPVYTAFFGFNLLRAGRYVQVRLGPGMLPGDPPPELARVYQDVDGTHDGFDPCGGWESAEYIRSIAAREWQPADQGGFDPDRCHPVYSHGNGDYSGYADKKRSFLFDHERSVLEPDDLAGLARRYFGDYADTFGA